MYSNILVAIAPTREHNKIVHPNSRIWRIKSEKFSLIWEYQSYRHLERDWCNMFGAIHSPEAKSQSEPICTPVTSYGLPLKLVIWRQRVRESERVRKWEWKTGTIRYPQFLLLPMFSCYQGQCYFEGSFVKMQKRNRENKNLTDKNYTV